MALTITDDSISSDRSPHTARHAPGGKPTWEVSWLPGRPLSRNDAITAMTIADTAGPAHLPPGNQLRAHIDSWAAELGLTTPGVLTPLAQPPGHASATDAQFADPEAAG